MLRTFCSQHHSHKSYYPRRSFALLVLLFSFVLQSSSWMATKVMMSQNVSLFKNASQFLWRLCTRCCFNSHEEHDGFLCIHYHVSASCIRLVGTWGSFGDMGADHPCFFSFELIPAVEAPASQCDGISLPRITDFTFAERRGTRMDRHDAWPVAW